MAGAAQGRGKALAALAVGPVVRIAVKHKIGEAAGKKMLRHQLRGLGVILQHARITQVRPPEAEVHCWLGCVFDKVRQVVPRTQPGQDAVAFPAPGNDLFAREIAGEVPVVFQGEFLDAAVQAVIIPAEHQQDALLPFACHLALFIAGVGQTINGISDHPWKWTGPTASRRKASGCAIARCRFL